MNNTLELLVWKTVRGYLADIENAIEDGDDEDGSLEDFLLDREAVEESCMQVVKDEITNLNKRGLHLRFQGNEALKNEVIKAIDKYFNL